MRYFIHILLLCAFLPATAQYNKVFNEEYYRMHSFTVITCIKAPSVEKMVDKHLDFLQKKSKDKEELFYISTPPLPDSVFSKMVPVEYFVYAHSYPESYMQTCSFSGYDKDEKQKLFAHIPLRIDGACMSHRQAVSLEKHRDSTLTYLTRCITNTGDVPLAYKRTILDLNAFELIPLMLTIEKAHPAKDTYLYSLLMELMIKGKFANFMQSSLYSELHGEGKPYRTSIATTKEKRQLIVSMAADYFKSTGK